MAGCFQFHAHPGLVDAEGGLTLRLSLDLEEVEKSLQEEHIFWAAATM